jgi:uncharacterized protein (DUF934 family)
MFPLFTDRAAAATATVAREIEFAGKLGATGDVPGVPVITWITTLSVEPV